MQDATENTQRERPYALMRMVFILLLLLSPLLPYAMSMAYNSYLLITLPERVKSLPVYPDAKLEKEFIQHDSNGDRCLALTLQYRSTASPESLYEFYDSVLLKSGWNQVRDSAIPRHRYAKYPMNIQISEHTHRSYRIFVTFDLAYVFQPGCRP